MSNLLQQGVRKRRAGAKRARERYPMQVSSRLQLCRAGSRRRKRENLLPALEREARILGKTLDLFHAGKRKSWPTTCNAR